MVRPILAALWVTAAAAAAPDVPKNADTSVIGISLRDPASAEAVLGKDISWEEEVLPRAYFVNSAMTEELSVTFHNGDYANSVSEFLVSSPPKRGMKAKVLKTVKSFTTGKGVRLGMPSKDLLKILGVPAKTDRNGARTTFRYEITDISSSPFLKHHNMPSYYGTYSFTNDKLIEYGFGFEYP